MIVACVASACSEPEATANLSYVRMYQQPTTTVVEFTSDLNIEALYEKNRYQKVVRKYLKCALDDDQNFDVENRMRYAFEGTLELQGASKVGDKITYRYRSHGDLYEQPPGSNDLNLLRGQTLVGILGNKSTVPCKVIMTVYVSSPYYSNTMSIPSADIVNTSKMKR